MITDERLSKAMKYLAETDEPCARAKARMIGLEKQEKSILAMEKLELTGSVDSKDTKARTSEAYEEWFLAYQDAVCDYHLYFNKRQTESLIVEVWRTEQANRRKGNI